MSLKALQAALRHVVISTTLLLARVQPRLIEEKAGQSAPPAGTVVQGHLYASTPSHCWSFP
jgi:hypothetical protein